MTDQLPGLEPEVLERVTPEAIVAQAAAEYEPIVARFCLLSGGGDSTALAHRMRGKYDALLHVDTGTALPGVREHVERLAKEVLKAPLVVYEAGEAYRTMVLGDPTSRLKSERIAWGMPGPGFHRMPYARLKDRQFEAAVRTEKKRAGLYRRRGHVMLISGARTDESQRRMVNAGKTINKRGGQLWVQPLTDWTNEEVAGYRDEHKLPTSEVSALTHRSGECNCGAFKSDGEREMLQSLWPGWFADTIESLEELAEKAQVPSRWGERPRDWCRPGDEKAGPACNGCSQLQLSETPMDVALT